MLGPQSCQVQGEQLDLIFSFTRKSSLDFTYSWGWWDFEHLPHPPKDQRR